MTDLPQHPRRGILTTWRAAIVLTVVVLVVGLVGTAAIAASVSANELRQERLAFDRNTASVTTQLASEVERYNDAVHALAASLGSHEDLRSDDFMNITAPLQGDQLFGIESVGFVVAASDANVSQTQAKWRAQGATGLSLQPNPAVSQHYFSVFIRTLHSDVVATPVIGDLADYEAVTRALQLSSRIDDVAVSTTFTARNNDALFAQDVHPAFALAAPAYGPTSTTSREFKGWVVIGLRAADITNRAFTKADIQRFSGIRVRARSGDGTLMTIASMGLGERVTGSKGFRSSRSIPIAQDLWTLELASDRPGRLFDGDRVLLSGLVLVAGSLATIFLSALVLSLAGGRARALDLVQARTADLRRDIERRRRIEADLEDARDESEAQKADLAAFAGFAAHDLKTPLTLLSGYVDLIQRGVRQPSTVDDGELVEFCTRAERAVVRMRQLIDSLLTFARSRDATLQLEEVELGVVALEIKAERIEQAAANHQPTPVITVQDDMPSVRVDAGMMHQLMDNLVSNATKYVEPDRVPEVAISATADETMVHVRIADRGIGIPDDRKDVVFGGFVRAHTDGYSGSGLGLAICKRIAERHGGHIGVADNPGGGTVFTVSLPLAATTR